MLSDGPCSHRWRVAEPNEARGRRSAQAEEGKNGDDDDHEPNNVDDIVHGVAPLTCPDERSSSRLVPSGLEPR
jgi:hypothetical protein